MTKIYWLVFPILVMSLSLCGKNESNNQNPVIDQNPVGENSGTGSNKLPTTKPDNAKKAVLKKHKSGGITKVKPDASKEDILVSKKDSPKQNKIESVGKTVTPLRMMDKININTTKKELSTIYAKNEFKQYLFTAEGNIITSVGTVIYPNDSNKKFMIRWNKKGNPAFVSFSSKFWVLPNGIQIGTKLADLVLLNGKNVTFSGFEWDYPGNVGSWEKGKLAESQLGYSLYIDLWYAGSGPLPEGLTGYNTINSNDIALKKIDVFVSSISIPLAGFTKEEKDGDDYLVYGTVKGDRVNVREKPYLNSTVVAQLNDGDRVEVLYYETGAAYRGNEEWYHIRKEKIVGKIHSLFLDFD